MPSRTRVLIGAVWLVMLVVAAGGMTVANDAVVQSRTVPNMSQPSGNF